MQPAKLHNAIIAAEEFLLAALLTGLILLSCLQIGLRTFFDSGLVWADQLLRHMVVWSGLLGALYAVSQKKHISIDLTGFLLPKSWKKVLRPIISLFCTAVCSMLCYASWLFMRSEMAYGGEAFLSIPPWLWSSIFFLSFGLMTIRYLLETSTALYRLFFSAPKAEDEDL